MQKSSEAVIGDGETRTVMNKETALVHCCFRMMCIDYILVCAGGLGMAGKVVNIIGWQNESAVSYSNYIVRFCLFNGSYWTYPEECCRGGMDSIPREEKQIQSGTQRKGVVRCLHIPLGEST